ncbi:hypothetical protein DBP12_07520 [Streptomyces sp. CS014]|nr:hypothetical protein DBP12_07520 [Streptomyces sp. CS014]
MARRRPQSHRRPDRRASPAGRRDQRPVRQRPGRGARSADRRLPAPLRRARRCHRRPGPAPCCRPRC